MVRPAFYAFNDGEVVTYSVIISLQMTSRQVTQSPLPYTPMHDPFGVSLTVIFADFHSFVQNQIRPSRFVNASSHSQLRETTSLLFLESPMGHF